MTSELVSLARAGDGVAFQQLTAPHRRELLVHCYRMLGSIQDAEDAVQDTLLSAWQGLAGFEERSSMRTWLYRIATNRCLNVARAANRRAAKETTIVESELPEPSRNGEIVWLEPFPDALLDGAVHAPPGPEAHYEQTEAITLAFVTALQVLPARQRAVLILREVLGYPAAEVATMLDGTVAAVNSALKRARATLDQRVDAPGAAPAAGSPDERELVTTFVRAYQTGDVDAIVALLTADAVLSMPPVPAEYHGRDTVAGFLAAVFRNGATYEFVPTRANGQPAFGMYLRTSSSAIGHGAGLLVLTLQDNRIRSLTRFDGSVLSRFGLPSSLPVSD